MKLTDDQRAQKGRELAEYFERRAEVDDERKKTAADYTAKLKGIDHRIARLAWSVNTGLVPEEDRQMEFGGDE